MLAASLRVITKMNGESRDESINALHTETQLRLRAFFQLLRMLCKVLCMYV